MSRDPNQEIRELSRANIETRNEIDLAEKRVALEQQKRALQQIEAENRTAHEQHLINLMEGLLERRAALEEKLKANPAMAKLLQKQLKALDHEEKEIVAMVDANEQPRNRLGQFATNGTN